MTESNFSARVDLTSVPRVNGAAPDLTHYPRFPLTTEEEIVISRVLTDAEQNLLSSLSVDEEKIHLYGLQMAYCDNFVSSTRFGDQILPLFLDSLSQDLPTR